MMFSQNKYVEFTYDKAGNRTSRYVIVLKSSEIDIPIIEDEIGALEIKLYPNPTKGNLVVDVANGEECDLYKFMLFDVSGKMLVNKIESGTGTHPFDITDFSSGAYILILETPNNGKKEYKIIKE